LPTIASKPKHAFQGRRFEPRIQEVTGTFREKIQLHPGVRMSSWRSRLPPWHRHESAETPPTFGGVSCAMARKTSATPSQHRLICWQPFGIACR